MKTPVGVKLEQTDRRACRAPASGPMTVMDFWYELASREPEGLNEEAVALLRDAEEVLRVPAAEQADEDDE
jgi:hypothetical protein